MITVSVTINRPVKTVWDYFTTTNNWSKWYGNGVKAVVPSWQRGAKILWTTGEESSLTAFVPEQEICVAGRWMDDTYKFIPEGEVLSRVVDWRT